jgi:hypothetical protein
MLKLNFIIEFKDESNNKLNNKTIVSEESQFPMSLLLNNKKYSLGHHSRMLACHSLERTIKEVKESMNKSVQELNYAGLWYRCLLQVIIIDKLKNKTDKSNMLLAGVQIGRKLIRLEGDSGLQPFIEYARKSLNKLKIDNDLVIHLKFIFNF